MFSLVGYKGHAHSNSCCLVVCFKVLPGCLPVVCTAYANVLHRFIDFKVCNHLMIHKQEDGRRVYRRDIDIYISASICGITQEHCP
jgi:hypothetical protein